MGELQRRDLSIGAIGGGVPMVIGAPMLTDIPWGPAVRFDGVGDGLLIDRHPLAAAKTSMFEVPFRPDGGAFERRWFHIESDDGAAPRQGQHAHDVRDPRGGGAMVSRRVRDRPGYKQTLIVPDKRFPVGRWYHVAQNLDGATYRSFVDGVQQMAAPPAFVLR